MVKLWLALSFVILAAVIAWKKRRSTMWVIEYETRNTKAWIADPVYRRTMQTAFSLDEAQKFESEELALEAKRLMKLSDRWQVKEL